MEKPNLYSVEAYNFMRSAADIKFVQIYVLEIKGVEQLQNIEKYEEAFRDILGQSHRVTINLQPFLIAKVQSRGTPNYEDVSKKLEKKFTFVKNTPENLETLIHVLALAGRINPELR